MGWSIPVAGAPLSLGVTPQDNYMHTIDELLDMPISEAIAEIENNPAKIYGMLMMMQKEPDGN